MDFKTFSLKLSSCTYKSLVLLLLGGAELGAAERSEAAGHQDRRHQQPLQGGGGAINFDTHLAITSPNANKMSHSVFLHI